MNDEPARVVVVGAGVTGLVAAEELASRGSEVTVLEASDRTGGKIGTSTFAGRSVDWGADAFLARTSEGTDLCRRLGLGGRLVSPATGTAAVYSGGSLRTLPRGLVLGVPTDLEALTASGLVSQAGVQKAALDLSSDAPPLVEDVSVGALVRDRLGDEVFSALVAPLLSGVHAGDPDLLSLQAGAPQLAAAARRGGSLIVALREAAAATDPAAPVFHGIAGGTQLLVDALVEAISGYGGRILTGTPAERLERSPAGSRAGWRVMTPAGTLEADSVVLAAPAHAAAPLLERIVPDVAQGLGDLQYASVAMVALAVRTRDVGVELDRSGFLVAEGEGPGGSNLALTACSWASAKWAHLADPEVAVLRASAGRAHDDSALVADDDELVRALLADLGTTMGLSGSPLEVRVSRWPRSLPQFRPGHLDRVAGWRAALEESAPSLALVGAAMDGLGIPACIAQGRAAAAAVVPLPPNAQRGVLERPWTSPST